VSVLATFRHAGVDRELAAIVEGESLFNDGVAVVLYVILLAGLEGAAINVWVGLSEFLRVVGGGVLVGWG
jgi:CPA1 family monovalent cation:H+ antiporter